MILIKANQTTESGDMPDEKILTEMLRVQEDRLRTESAKQIADAKK